ncbi:MAG: hypothetical protein MH204_05910 [Fimbriimonadaceae bacterium]|nr:hypothetical protein [Fimbriimonadaceae bacterium]
MKGVFISGMVLMAAVSSAQASWVLQTRTTTLGLPGYDSVTFRTQAGETSATYTLTMDFSRTVTGATTQEPAWHANVFKLGATELLPFKTWTVTLAPDDYAQMRHAKQSIFHNDVFQWIEAPAGPPGPNPGPGEVTPGPGGGPPATLASRTMTGWNPVGGFEGRVVKDPTDSSTPWTSL